MSALFFWVGTLVISVVAVLAGYTRPPSLWTFADFPGFEEHYDHCEETSGRKPSAEERFLLHKFRPRIVLAPGVLWPIDFYRAYLPNTVMRDDDREERIVVERVTREVLKERRVGLHFYLDLIRVPDLRRE